MRIALAQIDTIVGDLAGNEAKILAAYRRGVEARADLVLCPELSLVGYPPRDLLLKPAFVEANLAALRRVAAATGEVGLLVGFVGESARRPGRGLTNSAALLARMNFAMALTSNKVPGVKVPIAPSEARAKGLALGGPEFQRH